MPKELNDNAKKWVAALRSGEFKQGQMFLRTETDTFCCLGVACELAAQDGIIEKPSMGDGTNYFYYDGKSDYLPLKVIEWLGLRSQHGHYREMSGEYMTLAHLNDHGSTFEQIANIIESQPKGLFKES